MGARTDFVRAMLFGVVIGVAITTAFFQLRGSTPPAPPAAKPVATGSAPATVTIEPVRDGAIAPLDAGSPPLVRDIADRLAKLGVPFEPAAVSCTAQCCTVAVDDITYDEHADHIRAALDVTPGTKWNSRQAGTVRTLEKCW